MLKFNLPNLNKLMGTNKPRPIDEACTEQQQQEQAARTKPKYSAYRTVLVNHQRRRERIKECDADASGAEEASTL